MFAAFAQFFSFVTLLFSAAEKAASAVNHLAGIGDEMASSFAAEQRVINQRKLEELMKSPKKVSVAAVP